MKFDTEEFIKFCRCQYNESTCQKMYTDCEDRWTGIQDHEDGIGRPSTYSTNVNAVRDEEMILKNQVTVRGQEVADATITRKKMRPFVGRCDFKWQICVAV